jgi:large subunit ribosomal protein L9
MKVLLLEDVYKLGRAGDVKKVAAGYGRNYLIPPGLAVLASPGALQQVENIAPGHRKRSALNEEMSSVADKPSMWCWLSAHWQASPCRLSQYR